MEDGQPSRDQERALDAVFSAIKAGDFALGEEQLSALSDLDAGGRAFARAAFRSLDGPARFALLDGLLTASEDHTLLDFSAICFECLDDDDGTVRARAAAGLADSEDRATIPALLALARSDPDDGVRGEALIALGPFALRAAVGELTAADHEAIVGTLREIAGDVAEDGVVQASALSSVGGIDEPWVQDLIYDGFESGDAAVRVGAIQAMGRSADEYWLPTLINLMAGVDEDERVAAATAAGEIGSEDALAPLGELLEDEDAEVVQAAAAALGEIGGAAAVEQLGLFTTHPDPAVRLAVQAAAEIAGFNEDPLGLSR
jgi:HEAT repeat protein